MIEITYDFQKLDVRIKGHSYGAPKGDDLCCAGISSLTVALACSLKQADAQGFLKKLIINVKEGDTKIKAIPHEEYRPNVETMYTTIFNGYDAMSVSFPEYVSFKRRGVEKSTNSAIR